MKKLFLFFLLVLLPVTHSYAVLQEENLDKTITMLNSDLEFFSGYLDTYMEHHNEQRAEYWNKLNGILSGCQEYSLVLYSQTEYYIFGMSQAYQKIRTICREFKAEQDPFENWKGNFAAEITRYKKLKGALEDIPEQKLTAKGRADRANCVRICEQVQSRLEQHYALLQSDNSQLRFGFKKNARD